MACAEHAAAEGDLRLAAHLADLAVWAEPESADLHRRRAGIYTVRRNAETSLMSKGIFAAAARESSAAADRLDPSPPT